MARSLPSPLPVGAEVAGRYRVRGLIGQGGAGAVYRVVDSQRGVEVALKVHAPQMSRRAAGSKGASPPPSYPEHRGQGVEIVESSGGSGTGPSHPEGHNLYSGPEPDEAWR